MGVLYETWPGDECVGVLYETWPGDECVWVSYMKHGPGMSVCGCAI